MTDEPLPPATPRPLGALGPIAPLAFGCWRFRDDDLAGAAAAVGAAVQAFEVAGARVLVDNADVYGERAEGGAEALLGRVLRADATLRDRVLIATKAGIRPGRYDGSARHLTAACEASLRRLEVDAIDLFQLHRIDLFTPVAETAAALSALRDAGTIREVGVSNATPAQLDDLERHLPFPIAAVQAECSLLDHRPLFDGTLDWCARRGAAPLAYSPLGGGRLGERSGEVRPELAARLDSLAGREGVDQVAVCLAFVAAHPSRPVPIVGSQRPDRLVAAAAAPRVRLDRSDLYGLIEDSRGYEMP